MEFNNIEDICKELMEKAKAVQFLQHENKEVKDEANQFIEKFSKEHGMHSHTISPFRWYFESNQHMFEDGVIELKCNTKFRKKGGSCKFQFVDVSKAKLTATQE